MKNKMNRIFAFSFVFVICMISFIKIKGLEVNNKNNNIHLMYEIKEREEVLIKNNEIIEFYKQNYKATRLSHGFISRIIKPQDFLMAS